MNKQAQAGMEFLITYGWAILAAIVAIGVLTYFVSNLPLSMQVPEDVCMNLEIEELHSDNTLSIYTYPEAQNLFSNLGDKTGKTYLPSYKDAKYLGSSHFSDKKLHTVTCRIPVRISSEEEVGIYYEGYADLEIVHEDYMLWYGSGGEE